MQSMRGGEVATPLGVRGELRADQSTAESGRIPAKPAAASVAKITSKAASHLAKRTACGWRGAKHDWHPSTCSLANPRGYWARYQLGG